MVGSVAIGPSFLRAPIYMYMYMHAYTCIYVTCTYCEKLEIFGSDIISVFWTRRHSIQDIVLVLIPVSSIHKIENRWRCYWIYSLYISILSCQNIAVFQWKLYLSIVPVCHATQQDVMFDINQFKWIAASNLLSSNVWCLFFICLLLFLSGCLSSTSLLTSI